jgi:uncharacterized protein with gpF-like domain
MNRRRLWMVLDRRKAVYRRNAKGLFLRAFDKEIEPLWEKIEQASDIRDIEIPPLEDQAIRDAYIRLYKKTAFDFAKKARKDVRKMTKGEDEIYEDLIMQEILLYIDKHVGETITAVGNTSKELIRQMLDDIVPEIMDQGVGGGQATTMLRDRIQSAWHEAKRFRVERIARTEVNRASNYGTLEGMRSVSEEQDKVWISALAGESRDAHIAADGQTVGINEPFIVDGEDLQYPGDPAGSPGNTINCLCSMYYEIKR